MNYVSSLLLEIGKAVMNISIYISIFAICCIYLLVLSYNYIHNKFHMIIEYHRNNMTDRDYDFWKMNKIATNTYRRHNLIYPSEYPYNIIIDDIELGILQND